MVITCMSGLVFFALDLDVDFLLNELTEGDLFFIFLLTQKGNLMRFVCFLVWTLCDLQIKTSETVRDRCDKLRWRFLLKPLRQICFCADLSIAVLSVQRKLKKELCLCDFAYSLEIFWICDVAVQRDGICRFGKLDSYRID